MLEFPPYAKIMFDGYSEQREASTLRTEMESGPPKQARVRSRVMMTRSVRIYLDSNAKYLSFIDWYENFLDGGSLWFTYQDKIRNTAVQARFSGGGLDATPVASGDCGWVVSAKIETWG